MKSRTLVTVILAGILILLVMGVALAMSYTGWVKTERFRSQSIWEQPYSQAQSMKIIDLTGDGQDDLFIQNTNSLAIWDESGQEIFSDIPGEYLVSTMGDLDGDGVEDILAVYQTGAGKEWVLIQKGQVVQRLPVKQIGIPARIAVIRFASEEQVILGDIGGNLVSLQPSGEVLWESGDLLGEEVRGLDDALVNGQLMLAAIDRAGKVALINEQGQAVWETRASGGLRRMRAYDLNGDQVSELYLGGENGALVALNAANGEALFEHPVGQVITEIRDAEINGDPSSREVIAGGKSGGVWAFGADGTLLWSASVPDKVTEIAGIDLDNDGVEEVVIGDDSGAVNLFDGKGQRSGLFSFSTGITRVDIGKLGAARRMVVASQGQVRLVDLEVNSLPVLRFTPLLMGLAASAVILLAAWFVATNPPKPELRVALEDQSAESLQAQRRMLKENIVDVERLRSTGDMTPDAYLARLKDLRRQLADNETAMKKAGLPFKAETVTCPNCGGALPLGVDRCDYCGQTVIL